MVVTDLTTQQKYKLKQFVNELKQYRANHTELVTVYIPAGYELVKIIQHLAEEQGTASNIKSTSTRKNVQSALERMIQHLRLYKHTPQNGLCAFSGNIAAREGQQDVRVWSIEPPIPVQMRTYRCDKTFVLDILEDMMQDKTVYGLIVIDRRDANIALLKGKTIIPLVKTHSQVPGKFKAGGQSAMRFHRIIEDAAKEHYRKVAEYVKEQFLSMKDLKGILVGGPGPTKHDFVELGQLTNELKKKIIAVKDLSYTDDFGLRELVEKCSDVLADEEITREKKIMDNFLQTLAKNPGKVTYGKDEVLRAVQMGAVDVLILSESLDDKTIDMFTAEAEKMKSTVQMISTAASEGVQLKELGGVAAMLRYEIG
ncbi:MAG TPA: peptide chain release factor aRF-1 [Candidatus Nanoarchaeia archaeon]|nr:peptide chain release factor aRF-1 [Candidatus Nanoarchaeia archaeon]